MVTASTLPADTDLVRALRDGDESVFMELVTRWHASMLRVALMYVPSRAVAEEVVQETWLGVLTGIDRFEQRSSLRTWVYRILTNRAKSRGERERRTVPFSSLVSAESERDDPAVDPSRFRGPGDQHPGGWSSPPDAWPQERLLAAETLGVIRCAIDACPKRSERSSRCATSRASTPPTSQICSRSPTSTSASCCTAPAARSVPPWRPTLPELAHMPCQELVEIVTAYLDGSLRGADRERLEAHLKLCDPCVVYVHQFRVMIERIGHLHAEDLPTETQDALLSAFRGWNAA